MTFHEYPKALYADSQANGYAVAKDASEEEALRGQGLRMLPEWYDLERDAAAEQAASMRAEATADVTPAEPKKRGRPKKAAGVTPAEA